MIVMTPPEQPNRVPSGHPRRPPAHRSVSLKHSSQSRKSPKESDTSSDNSASRATAGKENDSNASKDSSGSKNSNGSPSSLQPLGRNSSGESSNAEQWFQASNNDVHDTSMSFADNDPPFFNRHSSSSETPPDAREQYLRNQLNQLQPNSGTNSLPLRTGLLGLGGTDGSSTEDFRGVIDDLTIENKALKRRLKKYEKLHDSHLKDEKLFEVRIHGLPPHKKRELEETLRRFASNLGEGGFPISGYEALLPSLTTQKTASSQTQVSDSAYASMSGQGSSAQSGAEGRSRNKASTNALRKQNIHTYLHHIPEGLLPQANPVNMSERAKKKIVVRRLEQIFAGKGAAAGIHQHPMQQQEVSHLAARADRAAGEAQGLHARQEGTREARIMARELKDNSNDNTDSAPDEDLSSSRAAKKRSQGVLMSKTSSDTEQRPTRPLDLDPHRAQVPTDNIEYMRHLGFSPPNPETEKVDEGHGWVYLNLLINLAQLHTFSVTLDFVRKALDEFSSKFEISNDGRKVRWRGGSSVTRSSSSGDGSSKGVDTPDGQSPRKRPKLVRRTSDKSGSSSLQQTGAMSRRTPDNRLGYTPLFFHRDSTDDGGSSSEEEDDDGSSTYPFMMAGDSTEMTSSGRQTTAPRKRKAPNDGPIIFYNNARFCTDLSGDRKANGNANAPPYTPAISEPVGKPYVTTPVRNAEKRGPLADAFQLPEPMDLSDNPIPEALELNFPPTSPMSDASKVSFEPMDLPVTGIGGVWPADNFAIAVESRHARVEQAQAPLAALRKQRKLFPARIASMLDEGRQMRQPCGTVHNTVTATERRNLMPSELPAAICYMPYGEDSTGDDTSDVEDEMSIAPESPGALHPAAAPQPVELHYASSEHEDDDDSDVESDSSLDLLAAARQIDPEAIRQQEREYDAQYADRLAEEIPTGSSAATAGGGSGFASPKESMSREDYEKAVRASRNRRQAAAAMKQSESMMALDPSEPLSDGDEVEDEETEDDTN